MAKFYGSIVKTGRVGGSVFAITRGTTIEKQYQPVVANPSTTAQRAQRAKLKLASQLSAVLGVELIPFGRDGLVSPRNRFVADLFNRDAITFSGSQAVVNMQNVRLTKSVLLMLRNYTINRAEGAIKITGAILPEFVGKVIGVRAVVMESRPITDQTKYEVVVSGAASGTVDASGNYTVNVNVASADRNQYVYLYAFMPTDADAATRYNMMLSSGQTSESVTLDVILREMAGNLTYSVTSVIQVSAATGKTQAGEPTERRARSGMSAA